MSCWQDLSGSSDMVQDQSVFCRKERMRHQSALQHLQTVREGWVSMRGWTDLKSANTTQWSDFPTGAKVCVVTRSGKLDMTRSSVLAPRVGWSTCWVKPWAAQISSRYSQAGVFCAVQPVYTVNIEVTCQQETIILGTDII